MDQGRQEEITSQQPHTHRCDGCGVTWGHAAAAAGYRGILGEIASWHAKMHSCPECGMEECYLIVQLSERDLSLGAWQLVCHRWRTLYSMGVTHPTSTMLCRSWHEMFGHVEEE